MFVFSATAKATGENKDYPAGEKHAALIFIVADDIVQARGRILANMEALDWRDVSVENEARASETSLEGNEKVLFDAFYTAREKGFAVVIYTEPVI